MIKEEGVVDHYGKVNVLLQAYISRLPIEDFALVSDSAYVSQNGGRIIRAMLEIAISRKWAALSAVLMGMSKAIEKRLWPFDQPLKQFPLKQDVYYGLETWADDMSPAELASMSAAELGKLIHLNEIHGNALLAAAKQFPSAIIKCDLRPLGPDVLRIVTHVQRNFDWNAKIHGFVEPFWLWVEDHEGASILQMSQLIFRQNTTTLDVDFVISMSITPNTPSVTIRFVSDRWMGAEDEVIVSLDSLHMPSSTADHTPKLDLPFLPLSVCGMPKLEEVYAPWVQNFNAIQTQIFWSLIKTRMHSLVCGPTGCGKSLLGQILAW
jgi:antiviral helicase SLH1